ncbi:TonB-dependent receptor plug domain-containing protein [Kordiimonas marina]|uniref:TonB-dependent receptor plug domain-containing protein n=1 Tax=Kordiimonas marina TaxID=2872312 RepID=UPI001FF3F472|nr:TonB-dependent receptor [Kordiimonas marina]MCJ9428609.1 TonB-dependent receptor [Kordiimonas marina]
MKHYLWGVSLIAVTTCASTAAIAQEKKAEAKKGDMAIEEVVVTGSRRMGRSAADTPAPVDVISGNDFANQGTGDMTNMLRTMVPSYNANTQPINDASTLVRPANLRGLASDQTLVLINGKREHRSAVITFLGGGLSDGAQGPDISVIPTIALKRVEVLRDGAAAQYGSDAIAGVMNFVMKDDAEGGSVEAKWGKTYAGDGAQRQLSANWGMHVTDSGFLNLSAEWLDTDPTSRSVERDDTLALIAAGNTDTPKPVSQVWGAPKVKNNWKTFLNFGIHTSDSNEIYAFANYAERTVEGGFFYRNPNTRSGVYTGDGGVTRLVGDMTPYDGQTCPGGIDFSTGTIPNPLVIGSASEASMMAQIAADPNCFVFNEMFPGGFTPKFGGDLNDAGITMGFKGELKNGMTYDVSGTVGRNEVNYFIKNTVNPSMGSASPNDFKLGGAVQLEKNFNVDLSYPVEAGLASPINIAGGFEWREEQFETHVGQPESFEAGVLAKPISYVDTNGQLQSVSQNFGIGSNGFNGYSPQVAGSWDRSNIAFYLDTEADVTDKLILGAALRYEHFSDFGDTTNFKVSGLYKITDNFRIRSSYSTGFRAPTVGQQHVVNISTVFENVNGRLQLAQRGTIPPTNPIAVTKGAQPLGPEKSKNFSVGFVADLGSANITVDYFNIKVTDRISQSGTYTLSDTERADLLASGITFASDLQAFRFYVNDFNTRTQGVDVVATIPLDLFKDGSSQIAIAGNYTGTKVTKTGTLDACRVKVLQSGLPHYRGNATFTHQTDKWNIMARANYYAGYFEAHVDSCGLPINPGAEVTFDASVGYNIMDNFELSVGADNLLNNYPDLNPWSGIVGAKYPVNSPMGFSGGFYYVRARYTF